MNNLSTRPFVKKTFYMDLKGYANEGKLAKDLKILGGKQEQFLNKDVSFVVSNRIPLKAQSWTPATPLSNPRSMSPQLFNDSALDYMDSPAYSPGVDSNPCIMSRGKSLLQKAREKRQGGTSDILEICKQWNIKVYHVQKVISWVEKYKALYHQNHIAEQKRGLKKAHSSAEIVQKIHSPFIKIEDLKKKYRARYKEFKCWTDIINPRLSQYVNRLNKNLKISGNVTDAIMRPPLQELSPSPMRSSQSPITTCNVSLTKVPVSNISISNSVSVVGSNKIEKENISRSHAKRKTKDCKRKSKKRYCEICGVRFTDLDVHMEKKSHVQYASNEYHYRKVQEIISTLPSVESFLASSCKSDVVDESIITYTPLNEDVTELYDSECISASCTSLLSESFPYLEPQNSEKVGSGLVENLEPPPLVYYSLVECSYNMTGESRKRKRLLEEPFESKETKLMKRIVNNIIEKVNNSGDKNMHNVNSKLGNVNSNGTQTFQDYFLEAHDLNGNQIQNTVTEFYDSSVIPVPHGNLLTFSNAVQYDINNFRVSDSVMQGSLLDKTNVKASEIAGSVGNLSELQPANALIGTGLVNTSNNDFGLLPEQCSNIYQSTSITDLHFSNCDPQGNVETSLPLACPSPLFNESMNPDPSMMHSPSCARNLNKVFESVVSNKDCEKVKPAETIFVGSKIIDSNNTYYLNLSNSNTAVLNNSLVTLTETLAPEIVNSSIFADIGQLKVNAFSLIKDSVSLAFPKPILTNISSTSNMIDYPNTIIGGAAALNIASSEENCMLSGPTKHTTYINDLLNMSKELECDPSYSYCITSNVMPAFPRQESLICVQNSLENDSLSSSEEDVIGCCKDFCHIISAVDLLVESVVKFNSLHSNIENEFVVFESENNFEKLETVKLTDKPGSENNIVMNNLPPVENRNTKAEKGPDDMKRKDAEILNAPLLDSCSCLQGVQSTDNINIMKELQTNMSEPQSFKNFASSTEVSSEIWNSENVFYVVDEVEENKCTALDCCGDSITICSKGASCAESSMCCTKIDCLGGSSITICSEDVSCKDKNLCNAVECGNNLLPVCKDILYPVNYNLSNSYRSDRETFQNYVQTAVPPILYNGMEIDPASVDTHNGKGFDIVYVNTSDKQPLTETVLTAKPSHYSFYESSCTKSCLTSKGSASTEADFSSSPEKERSWAFLHHEVDALCKSMNEDEDSAVDLSVNPEKFRSQHLLMQH